jgi:hypothetical protein
MPTRLTAAFALGLASVGVIVGSLAWAWATFDFWETVPLVPCVGAAGGLAALAVYAAGTHGAVAILVGLAVSGATFIGTALVTIMRWEG